MIHVIASISFKKDKFADLLEIYEAFVPKVHEEEGCLMYSPMADFETDVPTQAKDSEIITVIEKWRDFEAFQAHLVAPHSQEFRENIKGIVENVSIKVLRDIV